MRAAVACRAERPSVWAVVPAKGTARAKTRLGEVFDPAERLALFHAMLTDVLTAACACPALDTVAVVTADAVVAEISENCGAVVVADVRSAGQSAAVAQGAAELERRGVATMLTLPADVPCVTPDELAAVVDAHRPGRSVTIVPSRDGRGTNALALTPPTAIGFRFGDISFPQHVAEAAAAKIAPLVLRLPGFGLDIDTPDDVQVLFDRAAGSCTRRFLAGRRECATERLLQPTGGTPSLTPGV